MKLEKVLFILFHKPLTLGFELIDSNIVVYTDYEIHTNEKNKQLIKVLLKKVKKLKIIMNLNWRLCGSCSTWNWSIYWN